MVGLRGLDQERENEAEKKERIKIEKLITLLLSEKPKIQESVLQQVQGRFNRQEKVVQHIGRTINRKAKNDQFSNSQNDNMLADFANEIKN